MKTGLVTLIGTNPVFIFTYLKISVILIYKESGDTHDTRKNY